MMLQMLKLSLFFAQAIPKGDGNDKYSPTLSHD